MTRLIPTLLGVAALAVALAGCAGAATDSYAVTSDTTIIDVRTPQEFSQGHLEGAVSLDVTGGELAAALPTLDPDAEYVVYCRSGNRSAQAAKVLTDAGFTGVTDLGSLERAAEATGLPVVG